MNANYFWQRQGESVQACWFLMKRQAEGALSLDGVGPGADYTGWRIERPIYSTALRPWFAVQPDGLFAGHNDKTQKTGRRCLGIILSADNHGFYTWRLLAEAKSFVERQLI